MRGGIRQNAGRKKGFSALEAEKARELICRKLSENLESIIDKLIVDAKGGNIRAIRELLDRAYGKPVQMDQESMSSEPLKVIYVDRAFDKRFDISGQTSNI